ncbi:MAG: hypothetical protein B6D77_18830, partial [gamma proteobacterium symbiont of Ctena orbiculata]
TATTLHQPLELVLGLQRMRLVCRSLTKFRCIHANQSQPAPVPKAQGITIMDGGDWKQVGTAGRAAYGLREGGEEGGEQQKGPAKRSPF